MNAQPSRSLAEFYRTLPARATAEAAALRGARCASRNLRRASAGLRRRRRCRHSLDCRLELYVGLDLRGIRRRAARRARSAADHPRRVLAGIAKAGGFRFTAALRPFLGCATSRSSPDTPGAIDRATMCGVNCRCRATNRSCWSRSAGTASTDWSLARFDCLDDVDLVMTAPAAEHARRLQGRRIGSPRKTSTREDCRTSISSPPSTSSSPSPATASSPTVSPTTPPCSTPHADASSNTTSWFREMPRYLRCEFIDLDSFL